MTEVHRLVQVALVAAGVAIVALAIAQMRVKHQTVVATAQNIHDQLDALDPVARAAVVARLTTETAKEVQARRGER
jgi:hypothetical protein